MTNLAPWLVAALVTASAITSPAAANAADPVATATETEESALEVELFEAAQALDDSALNAQRGGFTWQGMQISLGADMRTFIDGSLALHSTVSWTAQGGTTTETVHGALTPAGADQLRAGILTTGQITMNVGDARVFLANDGQTALIQRADNGVQNILVNTASNVALRQEAEVTLGLTGYTGFAQANDLARITGAIGDAMAQATLNALGH